MVGMRPPPIPMICAAVPVGPDGILRGFVLVREVDGSSSLDERLLERILECWADGLCQLCGIGIERAEGATLLARPEEIRDLLFEEPPLHRQCADYLVQVDPRFRTGEWFAVHAMSYNLAVASDGQLMGGIVEERLVRHTRRLRPDGKTAELIRDIRTLREELLIRYPREEIAS
jgi:hypothetical protein